MSTRLVGTVAGIGASLLGVVLWIVLGMLGYIAGIAGAIIGMAFIFVYQKITKEEKSKYAVLVGAILIFAEVILAEMLIVAIVASQAGVSFGYAFDDMQAGIILDLIIGFIFSYALFIGYLFARNKKRNQTAAAGLKTVHTDNPDAIVHCKACGGEIRSADTSCPRCGLRKD